MGSLQAIASVVNNSAKCNVAQLVVTEDGKTVVPTYNWTDLFASRFRKFDGIKKHYHFRFISSDPGAVYVKLHSDTTEKGFVLLKGSWSPSSDDLPPIIIPNGLSMERQWYLLDHIREFYPEQDCDITCPEPTVPKPRSRAGTPEVNHNPSPLPSHAAEDNPVPPSTKKPRLCGTCKREGHNIRTCPDREH